MLPFNWIKLLPWIIVAALSLALIEVTSAYLHQRDLRISLESSVRVLGEQAQRDLLAKEQEGKDNLKKVKAENENLIPQIRNDAVANYIAAHPVARVRKPVACGSAVPVAGPGKQVDDGTVTEFVLDDPVLDTILIQECAVDAKKVQAWQSYCTLNRCPVE